jgi:hypothetical protein
MSYTGGGVSSRLTTLSVVNEIIRIAEELPLDPNATDTAFVWSVSYFRMHRVRKIVGQVPFIITSCFFLQSHQ